ncbi:TrkH-domain-containing protein, partial [Saccharata proteae CBS 121410]
LPPLNFITLHYAYFIGTCLLAAIIFWASSTPFRSVSFTDSLFLVVSAMTLAGLNTVNLSQLNTFQQSMLFVLIMLGSAIFVSAFVVHVRRRAFEAKFNKVAEEKEEHTRTKRFRITGPLSARPLFHRKSQTHREQEPEPDISSEPSHHVRFINDRNTGEAQNGSEKVDDVEPTTPQPASPPAGPESPMEDESPSKGPELQAGSPGPIPLGRRVTHLSMTNATTTERYFPSQGFVGRNSQFHHLNEDERLRLGGAEYKAIKFLAWVVPVYFLLWQLLGCLGLGAYVAYNRPQAATDNGLNPWQVIPFALCTVHYSCPMITRWVGSFIAVSAFNNSGMSLNDANMVAFQTSVYMLLTAGLLILAGNTAYPIFLRLIIWTMKKLLPATNPKYDDFRRTLEFVLDHPRRCYTNLFPSEHTWWLLLSVVILNGVDWVAFEILNIGNKAITQLPGGYETLDGFFQALAVRSGGFYVVAIPSVRISLQVLYVVMMYISVYPVVITMRNSNVYEERSLGIYADDEETDQVLRSGGSPASSTHETERDKGPSAFRKLMQRMHGGSGGNPPTNPPTNKPGMGKGYFVRQQLRAQLAHDAWLIVLAVFVIMIIEGSQFETSPATFSVFNVIFEVVSAYGCVGISVGVPDNSYSFCGSWHVGSKLVLCAVMLRGRHRGLPVAIDKAVLLPGEQQWRAEEEDAAIRMERSGSR